MIRHFSLSFIVFIIGLAGCSPGAKPDLPASAIEANNRGVGLMGYFQYQDAHDVFAAVVKDHPDWHAAKINLAIATLNLQTEGSEQRALDLLADVLADDPDNLRARYCTGLLNLYLGDTDAALGHFRFVAENDPSDAYAAYYLAQCLGREGDTAAATQWYDQALAVDGYLRSAYYGLFQIYQRSGDRDKAREMLAIFQKMEDNPQARQVEFKYTRMGPKATAETFDRTNLTDITTPAGPAFGTTFPMSMPATLTPRRTPLPGESLTVANFDGEAGLDLFVPSAYAEGERTTNGVIVRGGPKTMLHKFDHPLAGISAVNTAAWADFDNDGLLDVYLARRGENVLFRQFPAGTWVNVTASAAAGGGDFNTVDVIWLDADHDGDVDLFLVNGDGPDELLNNNMNGTFRPLAAERNLSGDGRPSRQVLAADLDNDRDVDILVLHDEPPHSVYRNDRLWDYQPAPGFDRFSAAPHARVVAADRDSDGQYELYTQSTSGQLQRWQPGADGNWVANDLSLTSSGQLAVIDLYGSGELGLLTGPADGWPSHWLPLSDEAAAEELDLPNDRLSGWLPVADYPDQGYSLIGRGLDGNLLRIEPGPGRHPFAAFSFSGKENKADSMRSNRSGIGTRFAARFGSRWSSLDSFRASSGPGQSLQPRPLGIGGTERMDYLAITWSDGVFQTELNLATGQHHHIEETQRQLSSCPVLFVWNGEEYEFVSDLLGVAGMGYAIGKGEYATPRPWENFQLPPGLAQPKDGIYSLKIAEPMEESCYLDVVGMRAYELPPGWNLVLDERMGLAEPLPTGEPRYYRHATTPSRVTNDRGEDVTAAVLDTDRNAAPLPPMDKRFIGRLAQSHRLDMTFDQPIGSKAGKPMLIIDGWVEYPYSQTQFSAWQAGAQFAAPTLSAQRADGTWQVIHPQFGYPAGMPRRMSLPLDAVPADATVLRLETNLEVYWDAIQLAWAEPCPDVASYQFALVNANLAAEGFAKRTTGPQRLPHYDDSNKVPLWDTRHQAGFYTELGDVTPLVANRDDALAIFGPGEAVTFHFRDTAPLLLQGKRRILVLETAGWCKDMDLYTRDGETIAPVPSSGEPSPVRDAMHKKHNTRYQSGF